MLPALPFTIRQLQVFASLCATRSFRRSAENLGISQASVSNQMDALERQLGLALFVRRRGQAPVLTAEGMNFLDDLKAFETAAEALAAHRRRSASDASLPVRYRILVGQGTLDRYIRPKLDRFLATNPNVELTFETRGPSSELARDIAEGRYDFVMVHRLVNRPPEPELRELALLRGGIYGHRKFAEGQQLPLAREQVNKLPFILPITYPNEQHMLDFYAGHGIRPRQVVGRTQHYDVMTAMTKRGVGVACLTDALLPAEMRDEVIMLHPIENWRLMWHRKDPGGDPRRDAVQAFLMSSVLQDPNYRTISVSAGDTDSAAPPDMAGRTMSPIASPAIPPPRPPAQPAA
jgi:DNA-binding transcriptional LysR family regulator